MRQVVKCLLIVILLGGLGLLPVSFAQSSRLELVFCNGRLERSPSLGIDICVGGSPIRSSPLIDIAKNAIYFGADDGNLYAIPLVGSERPRRPKWVFSPNSSDPTKQRPMRSTPVIDEVRNRIYIGADDGMLYAVDRDMGDRITGFAPDKRPGALRAPPALDLQRDEVYIGGDDGTLKALNPDDGKARATTVARKAKGPLRTIPLIDYVTNLIYVGSDDGKFYAIDRENLNKEDKPAFTLNIGHPVRGSAYLDILSSEAAIYFGADNGVFYAIDRGGTELYKFEEAKGPVRTQAAVDPYKNAVYFVSDDSKLYALRRVGEKDARGNVIQGREAGTEKFRAVPVVADGNPTPLDDDLPRSSPVVDRRLGATGTGVIIVGSVDGNLYGIDPDTGRLRFTRSVPGAGTYPSAAIRTIPALYVSGPRSTIQIYVGADDGGLYMMTWP